MATYNHGGGWEQVFPPEHDPEESLLGRPKRNMVLDQGNMKFINSGGSHAAATDTHCLTGASQGPGVASGMEVGPFFCSSPTSLSISHLPSCSIA